MFATLTCSSSYAASCDTDAATAYAAATNPSSKTRCYTHHTDGASPWYGSEYAAAGAPYGKTSVCTDCMQTCADAVCWGDAKRATAAHGAESVASGPMVAAVHACS